MRKIRTFFTFFLLLGLNLSCGRQPSDRDRQTAEKVKQEFLHAWNGYKQYAWGHDALKPLSKGWRDWYDVSLVMTPVDAFDTMKLMGLDQEAEEAKQLIFEKLSFDHDISVQVFEVTIRHLGGLLAGYQLDGDKRFLNLAEDLGRLLLPAFDSPTGMPYRFVHLQSGEVSGSVNNPAEIGTLLIEFGTLSKLTNDSVYYEKAKQAITGVFSRRSDLGLVGTQINVESGEWVNTESHISGMIDSYYEYLLKAWRLFDDTDCRDMWLSSIEAVNRYLAHDTDHGLWYGRADMHTGERTSTRFGALDAFFPAVLALGGELNRAEKLQASCLNMWKLHRIEPEQLDYMKMEVVFSGYPLRPEIIESAYYLYVYTGNTKYRDMGRIFMEGLIRYCRTETGYAHLKSVVTKEKDDAMESFFLAETLKYLYLLFADKDILPFDSVIFNTEAHPIRRTW